MPDPSGADDFIELGVAGLPTEFADGFFGTGHEHRGVAGAAGMDFDRDGVAGDAAGRVNHLADAETLAVAQIEDQLIVLFEGFKGQQMGVGKVGDMNIVTDAGAVGSGIVLAKNADGFATARAT